MKLYSPSGRNGYVASLAVVLASIGTLVLSDASAQERPPQPPDAAERDIPPAGPGNNCWWILENLHDEDPSSGDLAGSTPADAISAAAEQAAEQAQRADEVSRGVYRPRDGEMPSTPEEQRAASGEAEAARDREHVRRGYLERAEATYAAHRRQLWTVEDGANVVAIFDVERHQSGIWIVSDEAWVTPC